MRVICTHVNLVRFREEAPTLITNNMRTETTTRELTYGEKAVGLTFNPGGHAQVNEIKKDFALVIDHINFIRENSSDAEVKRMCSIAITEAQTAQMWAVKAATWTK